MLTLAYLVYSPVTRSAAQKRRNKGFPQGWHAFFPFHPGVLFASLSDLSSYSLLVFQNCLVSRPVYPALRGFFLFPPPTRPGTMGKFGLGKTNHRGLGLLKFAQTLP